MTPQELRDSLRTLLTAELGTYTLKSGSTTPAIAILNAGGLQTSVSKKEGVEVLISVTNPRYPKAVYSGVQSDERWNVSVIQYQPPTGQSQKIRQVLDKIQQRYPRMQSMAMSVDGNANVLEANRVVIRDDVGYSVIR